MCARKVPIAVPPLRRPVEELQPRQLGLDAVLLSYNAAPPPSRASPHVPRARDAVSLTGWPLGGREASPARRGAIATPSCRHLDKKRSPQELGLDTVIPPPRRVSPHVLQAREAAPLLGRRLRGRGGEGTAAPARRGAIAPPPRRRPDEKSAGAPRGHPAAVLPPPRRSPSPQQSEVGRPTRARHCPSAVSAATARLPARLTGPGCGAVNRAAALGACGDLGVPRSDRDAVPLPP